MKNITLKQSGALIGASFLLTSTLGIAAGCSSNVMNNIQPKNIASKEPIQREGVTEEEIQELKRQLADQFLVNSIYAGILNEEDIEKVLRVMKMDETMISDPLYYSYLYIAKSNYEYQFRTQKKPSTLWHRMQESDENYALIYNEIYQPLLAKDINQGPKVYQMLDTPLGQSVKSDVKFMWSLPLSWSIDPRKGAEEENMVIAIYNRIDECIKLSEKELAKKGRSLHK